MRGWIEYFRLRLKARTGFGGDVAMWAVVAAVGAVITAFFLVLAVTVWLADRYGALTATIMVGAFFLLLTIASAIACTVAYHKNMQRAQQALAVRRNAPWFNPGNVAAAMQIGRAVGWRKAAPLVAVGLLAFGLAREWLEPSHPPAEHDEPDAEA